MAGAQTRSAGCLQLVEGIADEIANGEMQVCDLNAHRSQKLFLREAIRDLVNIMQNV